MANQQQHTLIQETRTVSREQHKQKTQQNKTTVTNEAPACLGAKQQHNLS
eukprot:m.39780 g.39780  ORF g.39780 m.39780 type:complete len:50 (-) comp11307_c0_seq1:1743-1892(-)